VEKMKARLTVVLATFFIITLIPLLTAGNRMINKIIYSDIAGRVKIIGTLNKPIGEIVTVEGVIIDGTDTREKGDAGKVLLKVQWINGKKLQKGVNLPVKIFQWSAIHTPKVNEHKKYIGYETGAMSGIPRRAFNYMPQVTTEDFHFSTYFQICKELK
jgi:hypothetical protein